jgi:hypothetical protein
MNPIIFGIILFTCFFLLFIIVSYYEAKKKNKENQEVSKKAKKFWNEVEFNEDYKICERPYFTDEINN